MAKQKTENSIQSQGTSLRSKVLPALDPSYFGINEQGLSEWMVYVIRYARHVQFVNDENEPDGNWSDFFEKNLAFVIAKIACSESEKYANTFKTTISQIKEEIDPEDRNEGVRKILFQTHHLFELVNDWYSASGRDLINIDKNKLADHLQSVITQKLNKQFIAFQLQLSELNAILFSSDKQVHCDFAKFERIWHKLSQDDSVNGGGRTIDYGKVLIDLSRIHKEVLGAIVYLKEIAPRLLEDCLANYPYHPPHISLLISFLKVYQSVQRDLNEITKKHLDYYYGEVLKQFCKPAHPDNVHVYFQPSEHIIKTILPKGTLLSAGVDEEGLDYTYETDQSVELNHASITDLRVIHVASNPLIGQGKTYKTISNIYVRDVHLNEDGKALDNQENPAAFDTFGKDQTDYSYESRDMQQASLGFAISSPILLLNEGHRKVAVNYKLNLKSMSSLVAFIEEMSVEKPEVDDEQHFVLEDSEVAIEEESVLSPQAAFHKLLSNIFKVRVTSVTGWFETESYEILPPKNWSLGEVSITLLFDIADPPITGYDEEIHGVGYQTEWPVLEFVLSTERAMYAYSYLRDLTIETCEIDVSVTKMKDLHVFNDLGKLDIHKPFYPFGSTPELGSYFLVGNEEIARKKLTGLSFDLHWHNLPRLENGFGDYYKNYQADINSSSFKVGVTGLSEFQFHPMDEKNIQEIGLFKHRKDQNVLDEYLVIDDIDLEKLMLRPYFKELILEDYSSLTRSGFLKFEITSPGIGFGFNEYPKLFSEAIVENANSSSGLLSGKDKKKVEIPNEPYAPQIRSIAMNYEAKTVLQVKQDLVSENDKESKDQFYHIHPFGKEVVYDNGLPESSHLVPQFEDEGYLLIGLENVHLPLELSLYFELIDNVKNEVNHVDIPKTRWRYLKGNRWIEFNENDVVFDSTNSFTTSGIIRLKLSSDLDDKHDILESDKYWISVSTPSDTEILSKTVFVRNNAVGATWKAHKPEEHWKNNIPSHTIGGLINTRSDINSVHQPYPSFGGRPMESTSEFYVRTSERLKHKDRCIAPEDYEKVILEEFPFLFQVKCISNFSHPEFVENGYIKIIVVPKITSPQHFYEPKVDYNQLDLIEKFLSQKISPFVKVQVVNPVFEQVRVSCNVRLENDKNTGEFIKKLENDLQQFICPWFGSDQREMDFGGSIERDDIHSFIESLPYVRFLTKLSITILHNVSGEYSLSDSAVEEGKRNTLFSSTPWSVLVPSHSHDIVLIDQSIHTVPAETRIETMKIGTTFVITEEEEEALEFPHFDLDKDTFYEIEIDLD